METDLDFWYNPTNGNFINILKALKEPFRACAKASAPACEGGGLANVLGLIKVLDLL